MLVQINKRNFPRMDQIQFPIVASAFFFKWDRISPSGQVF